MVIDPEIKNLIRPLNEEEYEKLKESILSEGIRDPLVVWNGILLDGHSRYQIAQEYGLEYKTVEIDLPDKETAKEWVIINQLGRRNLTPQEASYYRGKLYEIQKLSHGGKRKSSSQNGNLKTAVKLGKQYGVGKNTIIRDAEFSKAVDKIAEEIGKEAKDAILTGKANVPKKDVEILLELKQKAPELIKPVINGEMKVDAVYKKLKKEEEIRKAKENIAAQTTDNPIKPVIFLQDWKSWLDAQPQCDLLITDPPYMTDVDNIEEFAKWLPVALNKVKSTGFAYVFIGAYPEELRAYLNVSNPTQILIWTYKNTLGQVPKDRYKLNYQAILFFRMPDAPNLNCPLINEQWAVQEVNAPDGRQGNRYYKWQKPDDLAERLIRHSTKPGDLILDCFAGSGTFLIAASKLGRIAKGCEINEEVVKIAEERGCLREQFY